MKRYILLTVVVIAVFSFNAQAQSYKEIKKNYRVRNYKHQIDDYYSPALAGISSAIIPGFGQMTCGETSRGYAFIGGYVVGAGILTIGLTSVFYSGIGYLWSEGETEIVGEGAIIAGVSIFAINYVWSIVDAVRVAKIKNMYIRDQHKTNAIKFELSPTVINNPLPNARNTLGFGLTLRF